VNAVHFVEYSIKRVSKQTGIKTTNCNKLHVTGSMNFSTVLYMCECVCILHSVAPVVVGFALVENKH